MADKEVFTLEDLADYLGFPVATVAPLLHSGQIKAVKIGRAWRIHKQAVDNFLIAGSDEPEKLKKKYRPRRETSQPEAQA